jgi:hypothetical protein
VTARKQPPPERSRFAEYRDRKRGGPPRQLQPCGSIGGARRHQRAGETPLSKFCVPCAEVWAEHQSRMYQQRKARSR